ncbi:hypothetical protein Q8A73_016088 [Channa argus]|nr:hypothetical protein Q8A73_016088 [Channa argus]
METWPDSVAKRHALVWGQGLDPLPKHIHSSPFPSLLCSAQKGGELARSASQIAKPTTESFSSLARGDDKGRPCATERPQRAKMAAPVTDTGEFESWLNNRLDLLEVDREVYGAYILGVLQEEESDEEKEDALQGILSAFLSEDAVEDVCKQIIKQWTTCCRKLAAKREADDAEVQAIASMIEKQAQIVVKQKEVSEESKKRKEALLAQYANITDEEEYP